MRRNYKYDSNNIQTQSRFSVKVFNSLSSHKHVAAQGMQIDQCYCFDTED